jgi:hypothetical protein
MRQTITTTITIMATTDMDMIMAGIRKTGNEVTRINLSKRDLSLLFENMT